MAISPDREGTAGQLSETDALRCITNEECSGILIMLLTVLVVEDDETLRLLTVDAITLLGVVVIDCRSADEALPVLEKGGSIDLVMTDICMPGTMDGLDLARLIWSRWPSLPVILTSGDTTVPDGVMPSHSCFLRKPWNLDALHRAVRMHLPT